MNWHEIINAVLLNIKAIIKVTLLSTFLIIIFLIFISPISYRSVETILPPEKNSQISGLGVLLGNSEINNLISGGNSSANSQLFVEILKSRSAALFVVKTLKLKDFYNSEDNFEAVEKLQKKLNIDLTKEGIVKVDVEVSSGFLPILFADSDSLRLLASRISNCFVQALDQINQEKSSSKAKNARIYIESQLSITRSLLDSAEVALLEFQRKNKAIAVPEQLKSALDASAKLKSEIIQTELQINYLKDDVDENNKLYLALNKKLDDLRFQYKKFENGGEDYLLAFKDMPQLAQSLASLVREIKIQNDVYIMLEQQYYKEKIQENRDLPTIEILDEAIPPKKVSSPRILYSTVVGGIFSFLIISLIFMLIEKKKFSS
jgi:uncharacterized protein involved in exopolysaccharide biosynthesis